jgi:replicative DNA helicase
VDTGYRAIDDLLGELTPGRLIVAASEPHFGIQTLLLGVAAHVAARLRHRVAVLTVSSSRMEVACRFAGILIGASRNPTASGRRGGPGTRSIAGTRTEERLMLANRAEAALHMLPVTITETGGNLTGICAAAHAVFAQHPYDLLILLGPLEAVHTSLAFGPSSRDSQTDAALAIATELKRLACDLEVPLLVQSGLSPRIQDRLDRRPLLSDLPARGAISRVCDATVFLCSNDPLSTHPTLDTGAAGAADAVTDARVIVAHNRSGPLGSAVVSYSPARRRYEDRQAPA